MGIAALSLLAAGCTGALAGDVHDAGERGVDDGGAPATADAGADAGEIDAGPPEPPPGVAPLGALEGELDAADGDQPLELTAGSPTATFRVDVEPDEHVTFFLSFADTFAEVTLEVLRWDGEEAVSLGVTDAGRGLRTLAVFDPEGPRTFWARVQTTEAELAATLTVTRVPFEDGSFCASDCARLLQLPLPIDPEVDGYRVGGATVFRYQYGRRDLVMFVRHAGRRMISLGYAPFAPADLSQWDGQTPGTDTGYLRHVSHQRGKDIDLSLYGTDGRSVFLSYCDVTYPPDGGRECVDGTMSGYDGLANAVFFGAFFETGRVSMSFLDRELIPYTVDGADEAASIGWIDPSIAPLYSDGRHLQHWPNHDNHIHIRVLETDTTTAFTLSPHEPEPIEPP